jgi:hypothetical protein
MDRLNIKNEMAALDRKDREYFDAMTDEEKKKFSPYLMIRWGSSVGGDPMLQSYYLMSTNENLNKNFFDISAAQHRKLLWLLATTVSPSMGNQYHQWIAPKKKEKNNKTIKVLRELRPDLRDDDLETMMAVMDDDDIKELARQHGWTDKQIKDMLK